MVYFRVFFILLSVISLPLLSASLGGAYLDPAGVPVAPFGPTRGAPVGVWASGPIDFTPMFLGGRVTFVPAMRTSEDRAPDGQVRSITYSPLTSYESTGPGWMPTGVGGFDSWVHTGFPMGVASRCEFTTGPDGAIEIVINKRGGAALPSLYKFLSEGLPESGDIRIHLQINYITDDVVPHLLALLRWSPYMDRLQVLNLSNNRIGNEGLLCFADLLKKPTFKYLDVSTNEIDLESIRRITGRLEYNAREVTSDKCQKLELLGNWVSKIIWLPAGPDFDRLNLPKSTRDAHKKYYSMRG